MAGMRLWSGLTGKAVPAGASSVSSRGGWRSLFVREPFPGAWQRNIEWTAESVLAHHAVYACITLIASDVGKLRAKLVSRDSDGIWSEFSDQTLDAVLRKPNRYQNHIQFKEWWITSKLMRGNTYALKVRDKGVVRELYLLDPSRVTVLVAPDGSIYYQLSEDNLSGLQSGITVPASEIIHDRMNCLFHPLVGISPIFASGSAANIGLKIQGNSTTFFAKGSNPSGILTAPTLIDQVTADRLSEEWNRNFSGDNAGRVAVLGDGLKFEPMRMSAVDSQTIQHLRWSAETVCATFHVPPFKIGIGSMPAYQNAELMNQIYYSDCLQSHIESFEAVMDEGLGMLDKISGKTLGVELDLDALLRMDTATQIRTLAEAVKGSILSVNDARRKIDYKPVVGGDMIWMQQQNYSLQALVERDQNAPFEKAPPKQVASQPPVVNDPSKWFDDVVVKVALGLRSAA